MPARHRYKCLNSDNCPSYGCAHKTPVFIAMNSPMPHCPHCGCRKLEDWGEAINLMGGLSENSQNSDRNFRKIADRYGLTDMNNKDGQAVKRAAPAPKANISGPPGQTVRIGGYEMPLESVAAGATLNMPGLAQPIPVNQKANNVVPKDSPMMRKMTRIVGEHKGNT